MFVQIWGKKIGEWNTNFVEFFLKVDKWVWSLNLKIPMAFIKKKNKTKPTSTPDKIHRYKVILSYILNNASSGFSSKS